jgi:hypothetical protein
MPSAFTREDGIGEEVLKSTEGTTQLSRVGKSKSPSPKHVKKARVRTV